MSHISTEFLFDQKGLMEMVKGRELFFNEKRWLIKGNTGMRVWLVSD